MNRRELLKTIVCTTAAGVAASHVPLALADDRPSILPTVWSAPVAPAALLAVAAKQGQLHKQLDYNVDVWKTPDQLRAGVANGSMPVTMVPSYVAANFANRGKDVVLGNIMTFGLLQVMGFDHKLDRLEGLVGKKIVMPFKNDMPDLVLQILCKNAGIDFTALDIQYVSTPPEAVALFLTQRAELALLPEPLASVAQIKGKKHGKSVVYALDVQQQWGDIMKTTPRIPQAGMQIDRAFYQRHGTVVNQLFDDIAAAAVWIDANPDNAAGITAEYLPVPQPVLAKALPNANLTGTRTTDIADEIIFFFEQMYQLNPKIIGGKMPSKGLFLV